MAMNVGVGDRARGWMRGWAIHPRPAQQVAPSGPPVITTTQWDELIMNSPARFLWFFPCFLMAVSSTRGFRQDIGWWFALAVAVLASAFVARLYHGVNWSRRLGVDIGLLTVVSHAVTVSATLALHDDHALLYSLLIAHSFAVTLTYGRHYDTRAAMLITLAMYLGVVLALVAGRQFAPAAVAPAWRGVAIALTPATLAMAGALRFSQLLRQRIAQDQEAVHQALRDPLTGLANRAGWDAQIAPYVSAAAAGQGGLSVIVIDMDGLKDLNDSFSHATGDEALRRFGAALLERRGDHDVLARIDGDQFVIAVPHAAGADPQPLLDRYRPAIAGTLWVDPAGPRMVLSGSWGAATWGQDGSTVASLLRVADHRMMLAKTEPSAPPAAVADGDGLLPYLPRGRRATAEMLAIIVEASRDLARSGDPDAFLRLAGRRAMQLTSATHAALAVGDDAPMFRRRLRVRRTASGWCFEEADLPEGRSSLLEHVVATGEAFLSNDPATEPLVCRSSVRRLGLYNVLMTPLKAADGRVVGVLQLSNKLGRAPFTAHDLRVAQTFAALASPAIERAAAARPG